MKSKRFFLTAAAGALFLAANASADCPPGCVNVGPGVQQCSTGPTLSVTTNDPNYDCRGSAGYSFPAGTFYAKLDQLFGLQGSVSFSFDEDFIVTGAPHISTVYAIPQLYVSGQGGHDPGVAVTTTASFHWGSNISTWVIHWPETYAIRDTALFLPTITIPAGGTFRIGYSLSTSADRPNGSGSQGSADVQGFLSFQAGDILPEHVASCRGFSEGPVPTNRLTLGRLKAIYR
jgi:hypothetical protein